MAEAVIPVDLRNPGQVFACLGLMEAAEVLCGPAEGGYAWTDGDTRASFTLSVAGEADPVREILDFLAKAQVEALVYAGATPFKKGWKVVEHTLEDRVSYGPASAPDKEGVIKPNAASPVALALGDKSVVISHWGDGPETGRNNAKFWAGASGKPSATFVQQALNAFKDVTAEHSFLDPFSLSAPQSSSFNFDWRRIATALDSGFSVDTQDGSVLAIGFPLVELLAAVGLENARPTFSSKLFFAYGVSDVRLPTILARPIMSGRDSVFPLRRFRAELAWLGPIDKSARTITDSREELA